MDDEREMQVTQGFAGALCSHDNEANCQKVVCLLCLEIMAVIRRMTMDLLKTQKPKAVVAYDLLAVSGLMQQVFFRISGCNLSEVWVYSKELCKRI